MAGAVVQPAVAAIGICQFLKEQMKQMINLLPTEEIEVYEDLPKALCFAIDAIMDSVQQESRLNLLQVHMRRSLSLKHWEAEVSCKRYLAAVPFGEGHLFWDDLDIYI